MPESHLPKSLLADASLLLATVIWGTTFIIVKLIVDDVNPVAVNAWRFLIAAVVMWLVLRFKRLPVLENWRYGLVLGVILWVIFHTQTIGLKYTSATNAALLTGLFVLFTPLLGRILFKHRFGVARVLACIVAMIGLWLLTGGLKDFNVGDLLNIVTALAVAFQILYVDRYAKRIENRLALNFQQLAIVSALSFLSALIFDDSLTVLQNDAWLVLGYLAVFATVLTLSIQLVAQRYTSPLKTTLIFSLEPVFAALFAWWWGGEVLTPVKMMGGVLIILATACSELPVNVWLVRLFRRDCCGA